MTYGGWRNDDYLAYFTFVGDEILGYFRGDKQRIIVYKLIITIVNYKYFVNYFWIS
jgi:hypothetical protein